MIPLKSEEDLMMLRKSGKILAKAISEIKAIMKEGVSTIELDSLTEKFLSQEGAISAFKGYRGYPANICVSINEEIVHGIPGKRRLKEGDIVSVDLGVNFGGFFTDAAFTLPIGKVDDKLTKLIAVAKDSLNEGISKMYPDNRLFDISYAIQSYVEKNGFSVVRQFVGHGIGKTLHEEPEVPNFGIPGAGPILKDGMVFAIEPMVNLGTWESEILENGWTAVTQDRLPSAHFEHTVAITKSGPDILTN